MGVDYGKVDEDIAAALMSITPEASKSATVSRTAALAGEDKS